MSRRQRYKPEIKKNTTFALNITSMTDMFTIMLVFLLQTFSTSDVEITPVNGLRLPASNSTSNPVEGIKISISKELIQIGDKTLAHVKNQQVDNNDIDPKDKNFIPKLFQALEEISKVNDRAALKAAIKEGRILLQADESLPYQTIKKIMYTSSMAGFPQLKLVTVVGN